MVILISGASHTGKTNLSQKLLEKYKYPYLSIDHLKMGLIRSGMLKINPLNYDCELTAFLWPIIREIIKTVIENKQNLIIEGCYIPFNYQDDFTENYLTNIKHICLVMSENYINNHFQAIKTYANIIEQRIDDSDCTIESVINDNLNNLNMCKKYHVNYMLIDDKYELDL